MYSANLICVILPISHLLQVIYIWNPWNRTDEVLYKALPSLSLWKYFFLVHPIDFSVSAVESTVSVRHSSVSFSLGFFFAFYNQQYNAISQRSWGQLKHVGNKTQKYKLQFFPRAPRTSTLSVNAVLKAKPWGNTKLLKPNSRLK